ncbi:MAG: hypothetical protein HOP19_10980 [Acidobacteria bacterium]|nr:hypothetical protein [Acidobacteriota bacterium]
MIFTQKKTAATRTVRKLHSIHALLNGRSFVGKIEPGHEFVYALQSAAVVNGKLELTGKVSVKAASGKTAAAENVKATLRGVQGAIGAAQKPANFKLVLPSAFAADAQDDKPLTEFTDSRSGLGVIYLALSALDGKTLGVPFDLSAVQLNGRITAVDQIARDLQWFLNQAAAALESNQVSVAEPYVSELDRVLRG